MNQQKINVHVIKTIGNTFQNLEKDLKNVVFRLLRQSEKSANSCPLISF